ncbi:DNA translocase FtsK [Microvirga subterranea]|nr:DNA translocase FtsK [Microvirga subterranea]
MSSTQRPPFCPPPLPGTDEDYPAPRRSNVVPLRHLRAEAEKALDQDDNELAWRKAFVLEDGTRATRTPNRIVRPNDRHDNEPFPGVALQLPIPPTDNKPADVMMVEVASSDEAVESAVRSQIAELRSKFASAAPGIEERLTALALKEAALSSGGTTTTAEDSSPFFRSTNTARADQEEPPTIIGESDDAEDRPQAFTLEAPRVSYTWSPTSCLTACVSLSWPTASVPALSGEGDEIREAVAAFSAPSEDDAVASAATAPGMIEDAGQSTTTMPELAEGHTGEAVRITTPVRPRHEEQNNPDGIDFGYVALYEGFLPPALQDGAVGQSRTGNTAEASMQPSIATAASAPRRVEHTPMIVADTAKPPVPAPLDAPLPMSAKVVDLPKIAPSTWGHPPAGPEAAQVWSYQKPDLAFLAEPPACEGPELTEDILEETAGKLEKVIRDFGVKGEVIHVHPGPVVTLYEFEPAPGVKSSRVIALSEDIARSMSAVSARVAVIPGRNAIGIELPNDVRETVYLRELLSCEAFETSKHKLPLCLGKTIGGEPVIADLARMPHLLMAGTTGSGKSVAINTMILSLLYRFTPEQCRLIMVDPKMLELSVYDGIPHLLTPVVTDPKKAITALRWAVREMEDRYKKMAKLGVRNIDGFNARVAEARDHGEVITRSVQVGFDKETGQPVYTDEAMDLTSLPYIVVIVDEMADLMMVAGKEIEGAIQRLAQMARAAGIHVILATQRPSVDVITGTIKANFPTRISFQVTSKIDSRTILGEMGAEQLLGQGDMLHMVGGGRIERVHGPFCSDIEVERVVTHLKRQAKPVYLEAVTADDEDEDATEETPVFDEGDMGLGSGDRYDQAVSIVLRHQKASTSYIQRRLQIGYNRAASLMERMEKEGVVGPANHAGKRDILIGTGEADED